MIHTSDNTNWFSQKGGGDGEKDNLYASIL